MGGWRSEGWISSGCLWWPTWVPRGLWRLFATALSSPFILSLSFTQHPMVRLWQSLHKVTKLLSSCFPPCATGIMWFANSCAPCGFRGGPVTPHGWHWWPSRALALRGKSLRLVPGLRRLRSALRARSFAAWQRGQYRALFDPLGYRAWQTMQRVWRWPADVRWTG
jgi:hypothetical protein